MPNICNYDMHIKGKKKNCEKLIQYLSADYNCPNEYLNSLTETTCYYIDKNGNNIDSPYHIGYRVFNCFYDEEFLDMFEDEDEITLYVYGECAWSVISCMFNEKHGTYMGDFTEERNELNKALSLNDACEMLDLTVEIYSNELGNEFAEHYLINNKGNFDINESTTYIEVYDELLEEFTGEIICNFINELGEYKWKII